MVDDVAWGLDYRVLGVSLFGPDPLICAHFEWKPQLNVLYGVNGAGKSTVLQALANTLAGIKPDIRHNRHILLRDVVGADAGFVHIALGEDANPINRDEGTLSGALTEQIEVWAREKVFSIDAAASDRPGAEFTFSDWEAVLESDQSEDTVRAALKYLWGDKPELSVFIDWIASQGTFSLRSVGDKKAEWAVFASVLPSSAPAGLMQLINSAQSAFEEARTAYAATPSRDLARRLEWVEPTPSWSTALEMLWSAGHFLSSGPPAWAPIPVAHIGTFTEGTLMPEVFRAAEKNPRQLVQDELWRQFNIDEVYAGTLELDDSTFNPEWPSIRQFLTEVSSRASQVLIDLIPDAPVLTVEPADMFDWSTKSLVAWYALDTPTGRRVPLEYLSKAQLRWASVAIQWALWQMRRRSFYAALVVDEPELALHPKAIDHLRRQLTAAPPVFNGPVVAATHSPLFLNLPEAHHLHVRRNHQTGLSEIVPLQDELRSGLIPAGEALGLQPSDLLQLVRVFLIVEGKRDEAMLDEAFRDDLAESGVLIVPMHGTKKLHSIVDSPFIFDYTSAMVVVAVDRLRRDRFQPTWEKAQTLAANGDTQRASRLLGEARRKWDLSSEEETVLQFCRNAIDRRLENRLMIFGFEQPDLIYYLPAEDLVPGAENWDQLQREYDRDKKRREDIKSWLRRTKNVSTSPDRLRKITRSLDSLHPEITALFDLCITLAN